MFKFGCTFIVLIGAVRAQNLNDAYAEVTNFRKSPNNGDGVYIYEFQTNNGISQEESGVGGQNAQGSYSWISPEGETIQISYVADEFGYRPVGSAIPTPPPIPEAIQRALDYIQSHPSEETRPNNQQNYF